MKQISDNDAAAQAKYELEQALLDGTDWQLWEGETRVATLTHRQFEFSVEWGKLIFAWWTDETSQSWRVTAYELGAAELQLQATRGLGRATVQFTLRDPARWQAEQPENLAAAERRTAFSELLTQLILAQFSQVKIQRVRTRSKFSRAEPSPYVRLLLQQKGATVLALGLNAQEAQPAIDAIITAGLSWLAEVKSPAQQLWLFVPCGRSETVLERLTLLNAASQSVRIECFEVDENEQTLRARRPVSQAELLSLHPRGLIWPQRKFTAPSAWRTRIVALAPAWIDVREYDNGEGYAIRGLEFARTKGEARDRVFFGVPQYPDEVTARLGFMPETGRQELTERNFPRLENLVREILTHRRADATDLRHPFYRLRTEAWLESLLQRDVCVLDAGLHARFVYAQIPAWLGDERSVLDLLTINQAGRLVVIELKAVEDAQLPLQGLDYWLRVEQARVRGELAQRGLFPGLQLADQSPILYLVAPRLRFHRSFQFVTRCIAPEIEAYRIGLNSTWRSGVRVREIERLGSKI